MFDLDSFQTKNPIMWSKPQIRHSPQNSQPFPCIHTHALYTSYCKRGEEGKRKKACNSLNTKSWIAQPMLSDSLPRNLTYKLPPHPICNNARAAQKKTELSLDSKQVPFFFSFSPVIYFYLCYRVFYRVLLMLASIPITYTYTCTRRSYPTRLVHSLHILFLSVFFSWDIQSQETFI